MFVIVYDFGTSNLKTCLFEVGAHIRTVATANVAYELYALGNGGAEQDAAEWWRAVCSRTRELFAMTDVASDQVAGLAFCTQVMGMVLVDAQGQGGLEQGHSEDVRS